MKNSNVWDSPQKNATATGGGEINDSWDQDNSNDLVITVDPKDQGGDAPVTEEEDDIAMIQPTIGLKSELK